MSKHKILISEPFDFEGPDGPNKILVEGLGKVLGPQKDYWREEYFLVEVENPFEVENEQVNYLLVVPRYDGDTISKMTNSECMIGILRIFPDIEIKVGERFSPDDINYWAIGSIERLAV